MTRTLVIAIALGLTALGGTAAAQSLTLSPAAVALTGHAGQSTTQHLTVFNGTTTPLGFELVAKDVVVKNGQRVFVDAGELRGSVAATAVFSRSTIAVPPGQDRSVDVTVTLPPQMTSRAVVILFQGTTRLGGNATVSIGALLTFDLSGRVSLSPDQMQVAPPTASTNAAFSLPVTNDGTEPTIVRGAAVIVGDGAAVIGRVSFEPRRLLPGEQATLRTDFPGQIAAGKYRVVATIESAQRAWTRTTELIVP